MEVLIKGKLLDCDFENWEFEDKKGIRYFATIKDEHKKVVQIKVDEQDFPVLESMVGEIVEIKCSLFIKGTYNLKYKSFI